MTLFSTAPSIARGSRRQRRSHMIPIVLGCAGMADLARFLEGRLQVPVIDGVAAAVKFAEALVGLGLKTSKRGDLAFPLVKPYRGQLADYAPAYERTEAVASI